MTVTTHVPAFEHGRLRLWSFDGASEAGQRLIAGMRAEPRDAGAAMAALGAERVDPYWIDLVALGDIAGMTLDGYLHEGYEIPAEEVAAARLAPVGDHVLIVPSRAFADHEQTLGPDPALVPMGELDLGRDAGALRPMAPVASARRDRAPAAAPAPVPGPPAARTLRPGAILILLVIAAAFIWIVAR